MLLVVKLMSQRIFLLTIIFLFYSYSHATMCQSISGPTSVSINTSVAVLSSLPKGTKLWIGDEFALHMACWQNGTAKPENVHLYLNPTDTGNNILGNDIEVGVTLNGVDFVCSSSGTGCKNDLGILLGECKSFRGCESTTRKEFYINLRPFVSKKSEPSPNKEGTLSTVSSYQLLAFDGVGGVNTRPPYYQFFINNLNNFRYLSCGSTISISPETINFGNVSGNPKISNIIKEIPFRIDASKTCHSVFAISAILSPLNGFLDNGVLRPNDNNSVGIKILRNTDRYQIPYNSEFTLVESTDQLVSSVDYIAQLVWQRYDYNVGSFNVGLSVSIFYK